MASFWVFVVAVIVIIIVVVVFIIIIIIISIIIIIIIINSFFTRQSRILGQQGKGKATCNSPVPLSPTSQTPIL